MLTKIGLPNLEATVKEAVAAVISGDVGASITVYSTIAELPLTNIEAGSQAFVAENNRLYLWTGSGWFNIALINTNPTITGGPAASYMLSRDGVPTVITLLAADPEGIPITWSHQVTGGVLGNIATITRNNNVFTITPSTNEDNVGTFQLTFTASDGVNIATAASSFTLVFTSKDVSYNQSVVLNTTATNAGTNNVFVDSSSNNATITRNGNTTQGSFSPYSPAGWSGYFDGNGDNLVMSYNTALHLSGDFTIECWIYPTSSASGQIINFAGGLNIAWASYQFKWNGNSVNFSASSANSGYDIGSETGPTGKIGDVTLNQWHHVAVTRSGNVYRGFLNGVQGYTQTLALTPYNPNARGLTIGSNYQTSWGVVGNIADLFTGRIFDVRIVKGTALYTANFTPPTDPLTAVSGTSLLTLQDNRFIDRSTNNFAITKNGDTRIEPFSPFLPTVIYTPELHGGSAYFDGTGDFLRLGNDVNSFSGDVTVECWVYPEAVGTGTRQWLFGSSVNGAGIHAVNIASASGTLEVWLGSYSSPARTSTIPVVAGAWNHIALVRAGGVISLYVNGVSAMATATMTQWGRGSVLALGEYAGEGVQFFRGFISDYQYITGAALYTANFTPPTAPTTPIANTYRQLNFTNSNIFDETGKVVVETKGSTKSSTTVTKYGDTSMYFDGTSDTVAHAYNTGIVQFGTGDFTVEMWIYLPVPLASSGRVLGFTNASATTVGRLQQAQDQGIQWIDASNLGGFGTGANIQLSQNTWTHVAFSRSGTTLRYFKDGVQVASGTDTSSYNTRNFSVGGQHDDNWRITAYISDLRITRGVARYTANFTPPTQKLGYNNTQ